MQLNLSCGETIADLPFEQVVKATSEQKALYAFTRRKIDNPLEPFDVTKYPLPPGYP